MYKVKLLVISIGFVLFDINILLKIQQLLKTMINDIFCLNIYIYIMKKDEDAIRTIDA